MKNSAKDEDVGISDYGGYVVRDDESFNRITLLLPSNLLQVLRDEHLAAEAARKAQEDEELQQSTKSEDPRSVTPSKPRSAYGASELDLAAESQELTQAAVGREESAELVAVYDVLEPLKLIQDLKTRTPDKEIHKRHDLLYKQLKSKGHLRALAQPKVDLQELEHMRRAFPHFSAVLDLVRDQYAFSELTGKPFVIPPILLGGDPGIGKTRFSQELAKALGTVMHRLAFDNGQTGNVLLGSDKHWANTAYGVVFEMVVLGYFANPIILLDEVDKASHWKDSDPLASLHTLLETVTSQRVRDLSVDLEFNASRVIWIATANNLQRIPQSLRSRFHEFWIQQPNGEQALQMASVLAQDVHQEMNLPDFQPPAKEIVHFIAHLTAREQIQALRRAYASAKVADRSSLTIADLPEQVRREALEIAGGEAPPTGWIH